MSFLSYFRRSQGLPPREPVPVVEKSYDIPESSFDETILLARKGAVGWLVHAEFLTCWACSNLKEEVVDPPNIKWPTKIGSTDYPSKPYFKYGSLSGVSFSGKGLLWKLVSDFSYTNTNEPCVVHMVATESYLKKRRESSTREKRELLKKEIVKGTIK